MDAQIIARWEAATQKAETAASQFKLMMEGGVDVVIPVESGTILSMSNLQKKLLDFKMDVNEFVDEVSTVLEESVSPQS